MCGWEGQGVRCEGVEGGGFEHLSCYRNNHSQGTAYLVGQKMGEMMVREWGLDRVGGVKL